MNDLMQQEIFEIEVLNWLKNKGFIRKIIFGGGTMLRLCHGLRRYSVDLDFWIYNVPQIEGFFQSLKDQLHKDFFVSDAQNKFYTLLFEIKKNPYPQKLKIEIRKELKEADFQEKIAYSKYAHRQVLVKGFTLEQMMKNKIKALLERKEVRDAFDIEFLIRSGISLSLDRNILNEMKEIIKSFKKSDYFVKLGSLLEPEAREYYKKNKFDYLLQSINQKLSY
ncbi:MAG: nucleotidyl transferase AbiEii/AbiGii toxin family protein [Candidatus Atribacteria bacterium]|nr:nucleotidyl transferase AbiEii/AbiGii toxin family protein [Candidatus Atribacteria bacterium]